MTGNARTKGTQAEGGDTVRAAFCLAVAYPLYFKIDESKAYLAGHALQPGFLLAQFQPVHPASRPSPVGAGDVDDLHPGMHPAGILLRVVGLEGNVRQQVDLGKQHQFRLEED